jgi:membrane protein
LILALVVSVVGSALLNWLSLHGITYPFDWIVQGGSFVLPPIVFTIISALVFRYLPRARIRWTDIWPGAILTGILFWLGGFFIGIYLNASWMSTVYGAASSMTVFLIWVFASVAIVLYGAVFVRVFTERHGQPIIPQEGVRLAPSPSIKRPQWLADFLVEGRRGA